MNFFSEFFSEFDFFGPFYSKRPGDLLTMSSGLPKSLLELSIQWQKWFPHSELITLKTVPEDLADIITQVEQKLEYFDALVKSLETTDAANKAAHMKYVTPVRVKIWQNCICPTFSDRYLGLVGGIIEWNAVKANIIRIIGKVDEGAQKRKAKRKLGSMTRRVDANEPFWQFLARITQVAKSAWSDESSISDAIETVWLDNLRPMDRQFLVHMPPLDSEKKVLDRLSAEAEYLDRGKMYKRATDSRSVSHLEVGSSDSSYAGALTYKRRSYDRDPSPVPSKPAPAAKPAASSELSQLMVAMQAMVESQTKFQEESRQNRLEDRNRLDVIESRLNSLSQTSTSGAWSQQRPPVGHGGYDELSRRISAIEKGASADRASSSTGTSKKGNKGKSSGQTESKGDKPRRKKYDPCFLCGLNGHHADKCQGTTLSCNYCGQVGHIQSSRHHHPEINKFIGSKN